MAKIGKEIAIELRLKNPNTYTGNCFRNTAIAMAIETGISLEDVQATKGFQLMLKKITTTTSANIDECSKRKLEGDDDIKEKEDKVKKIKRGT